MPDQSDGKRSYDYVPEWQLDEVPLRDHEPEAGLDRFLRQRDESAEEAREEAPAGEKPRGPRISPRASDAGQS